MSLTFRGKRIHFVGIGGVSMSALARLAELDGAAVTGSDANQSGHDAKNINSGLDFVVKNAAIADDNPEVLRARCLGIPVIGREKFLAEIESRYVNRIAVAGSHGKSTTTAMIGAVLTAGGLKPTVHNGALPNLAVNGCAADTAREPLKQGGISTEYFVTEACEFKRSFLELSPTVAVLTNIDFDHADCYRGLDDIKAVFDEFCKKAPTVFRGGDTCEIPEIKLSIPGRHNIENARLAYRAGRHFGIDTAVILRALYDFKGIDRRFQEIGVTDSGARLITDYAHHPNEIITTIQTAADLYGQGRFLIVFQPHTYTRTVALFDDFVKVLKTAPCIIYKTYAAREKPVKGGTAYDIARAVGCRYFARPETLRRWLRRVSPKYDAVILTGAGDINRSI